MKRTVKIASGLLVCLFIVGCNSYDRLLKSNDFDAKYAAAMRYYEANSYSKAIQLFENLTLYYRGRENAENIAWFYAQALYKEKDYYTAAYQFKRFARQFPYSDRTEEAAYLSAYCKYLDSPPYSLDQSITREAISEMETFVERWPRSLHIPEVNHYLDEMREKLLKKDYEIAYGYYFVEEYRAAYESLKHFISLYPEASMREDAIFYLLQSGYRYAKDSREDKQRERYQQVLADYERFHSSLRTPSYVSNAADLYTKSRAALSDIEAAQNANN
ncbi:MAG: outer membrane protein assembly factor BamD [Bacteroidales bacterium]|nr:outer membrane protein assembly factor BamD [Bacteroidales bacterium]